MRRVLLAVACLAILCLGIGCGESPQDAFEQVVKHAEAGEWGKVYDRMDRRTQEAMNASLKMMAGMASAFGKEEAGKDLSNASGREIFIHMCEKSEKIRGQYTAHKVVSVQTEGDRAVLTVSRTEDGSEKTDTVHMIKEDGTWKFTGPPDK